MHLGYKTQPSKTKCIFFPPPQYFDKMEATATLENGTETQAEIDTIGKCEKAGFMTYTKHFMYLGSYISFSLQESPTAAATKVFGALTKFWYNQHMTPTANISSSEPSQ